MRTRSAAIVVGVAAILGTLTGAVVLPDYDTTSARDRSAAGPGTALTPPPATSSTALPSTSASSSPRASASTGPSPSETPRGPVTTANLLRTSDFTKLGLKVTAQPTDDSRITVPACPQDRQTTATKIAASGPPLQRVWDGGSVRAYQEAFTLPSTAEATTAVTRILGLLESCHEMLPGHFVSGPTHRAQPGPEITASWVGIVPGKLNVTGRAPEDPSKIAGGMAVVRNGVRVAVLDLNLCNSGGEQVPCTVGKGDPYHQLDALAMAAALRLG